MPCELCKPNNGPTKIAAEGGYGYEIRGQDRVGFQRCDGNGSSGVNKMRLAAGEAAGIRAAAGECPIAPVDLTSEASAALADTVGKEYGTVDVLVNSAGIYDRNKKTHGMDERAFDLVQAVNLKGIF